MVPSYKGFFPKVRDKFGNRYAASASEALVEFKKEHLMRQVDYEKMLDKIAQQNHKRVDERFKNSRVIFWNSSISLSVFFQVFSGFYKIPVDFFVEKLHKIQIQNFPAILIL
jgi:hypothetical protein